MIWHNRISDCEWIFKALVQFHHPGTDALPVRGPVYRASGSQLLQLEIDFIHMGFNYYKTLPLRVKWIEVIPFSN